MECRRLFFRLFMWFTVVKKAKKAKPRHKAHYDNEAEDLQKSALPAGGAQR